MHESITADEENAVLNSHLNLSDRNSIDSNHNPYQIGENGRNSNHIKGNSKITKMLLLTQIMAGLQLTWSVELAYGTPYLLDLGLSKSQMSLVWIAGPLSVGAFSDRSTSKYGRRRPYLIVGSLMVINAFILIGWTKEISETASKLVAVFAFYNLDFAINAVMAAARAIIVDCLPPSQQEEGTAWAGKMVGIGSVIGYFMGYINLMPIFPFMGDQLKALCILASISLLLSDALICWAVSEQIYTDEISTKTAWASTMETFHSIFKAIFNLPKPVQYICNVQFFAWMGWFPFLFYSTTWVSEIYVRENESSSDDERKLREGSYSLLLFSLVGMIASFVLPHLVTPSGTGIPLKRIKIRHFLTYPLVFLTLPKLWTLSHFIFALAMFSTWWTKSVFQADLIVSFLGISWATSMWAPFSLLGEIIATNTENIENTTNILSEDSRRDSISQFSSSTIGLVERNRINAEDHVYRLVETSNGNSNSGKIDSGTILGIHNMYIVLPQFCATFFSSIVFALLDPGSITSNNNEERNIINLMKRNGETDAGAGSIGFVFRCGGLMAIIAGIYSIKLWK
ncbi:8856_t:CDS:2 [Diversispora eburnea]|uniref:8856_t:CDS:1 n=1 Tax=Diversispora eburnea TaxID=1213867 RepID=A0A9N8W3D7_9GLOM|nr:8856_t:CDS:2 [Diversispora eburnea]